MTASIPFRLYLLMLTASFFYSCESSDPVYPDQLSEIQIKKINYETGDYNVFTYDEKKQLTSVKEFNSDGSPGSSIELFYNSEGRIEREQFNDIFSAGHVVYHTEYNNNNKVIRSEYSIITSDGLKPTGYVIYHYSGANFLSQIEQFLLDGRLIKNKEYSYDNNGNIKEIKITTEWDTQVFSYEYDNMNNPYYKFGNIYFLADRISKNNVIKSTWVLTRDSVQTSSEQLFLYTYNSAKYPVTGKVNYRNEFENGEVNSTYEYE